MADVMGRVVSAVAAGGVPIHRDLWALLASVGIDAHPAHDQDTFLEDLVPLYIQANPQTVSSRNERFAGIAEYVAAQQVFHAGDGRDGGGGPSAD
jgi:hypothetical protein